MIYQSAENFPPKDIVTCKCIHLNPFGSFYQVMTVDDAEMVGSSLVG